MLALIERPPAVELEGDGDEPLTRYVAVAENTDIQFVCILYLNTEDGTDCRDLVARWFLSTGHGVPTRCTFVAISDEAVCISMTSNDDEVCKSLGIEAPPERKGKS